jgi:DNA-binding transcriptional LysR family regulator
MELRHLEYFVAVAEEGSFTRAAARLHVVQSAVSAGVQALEHELGVRVLHRTSRQVRLTDTGEIFLVNARETLASAQRARDAVDELRGGLRGVLSVGTMTSTGAVDLPAVLGRFRQAHPRVTIRVTTRPGGSRELARALVSGELDVAILSISGSPPRDLIVRQLDSAPMRVLVPVTHPLAARGNVRLAELAEESFVDFPAGYGNRTVVDRMFEQAGITRHVSVEVSESGAVADYVRHHLGIALVADSFAHDSPDLAKLDIADTDLRWQVCVARARVRPASASVRAFETMVIQHAEDHRPAR